VAVGKGVRVTRGREDEGRGEEREREKGGGNVLCMQEMKSNQWSKRVLLGEN